MIATCLPNIIPFVLLDKICHFEISRDDLLRSSNVKLIGPTTILQQSHNNADVCELSMRSMICLCVANNEESMKYYSKIHYHR